MIGKIIGAIAGQRVSRDVGGVGGTGGALLGVGAATILRRLGPVGMVAAAVGAYAFKKHREKREAAKLPRVLPGRNGTF